MIKPGCGLEGALAAVDKGDKYIYSKQFSFLAKSIGGNYLFAIYSLMT